MKHRLGMVIVTTVKIHHSPTVPINAPVDNKTPPNEQKSHYQNMIKLKPQICIHNHNYHSILHYKVAFAIGTDTDSDSLRAWPLISIHFLLTPNMQWLHQIVWSSVLYHLWKLRSWMHHIIPNELMIPISVVQGKGCSYIILASLGNGQPAHDNTIWIYSSLSHADSALLHA